MFSNYTYGKLFFALSSRYAYKLNISGPVHCGQFFIALSGTYACLRMRLELSRQFRYICYSSSQHYSWFFYYWPIKCLWCESFPKYELVLWTSYLLNFILVELRSESFSIQQVWTEKKLRTKKGSYSSMISTFDFSLTSTKGENSFIFPFSAGSMIGVFLQDWPFGKIDNIGSIT